jgi:predicted  nucleic acid-binding Zn-ribbon protein
MLIARAANRRRSNNPVDSAEDGTIEKSEAGAQSLGAGRIWIDETRSTLTTRNRTGDPMKDRRGLIEHELDTLRTLRDELKVRAHLGRAEVRDLWEEGEKRFRKLEAALDQKRKQAREPIEQIEEAAELLIEEIKHGYDRLRKLI